MRNVEMLLARATAAARFLLRHLVRRDVAFIWCETVGLFWRQQKNIMTEEETVFLNRCTLVFYLDFQVLTTDRFLTQSDDVEEFLRLEAMIDISCIPELEIDDLLHPLHSTAIHEVFHDHSHFCHVKMLRNCRSIGKDEMNVLKCRENVFDVREFHGKKMKKEEILL